MKTKSNKTKKTPKKAVFNPDDKTQSTQALIAEYERCHPLNRLVRK
jgi:hypothetical protein